MAWKLSQFFSKSGSSFPFTMTPSSGPPVGPSSGSPVGTFVAGSTGQFGATVADVRNALKAIGQAWVLQESETHFVTVSDAYVIRPNDKIEFHDEDAVLPSLSNVVSGMVGKVDEKQTAKEDAKLLKDLRTMQRKLNKLGRS